MFLKNWLKSYKNQKQYKIMQEKQKNDKLLTVLNVVQSDINTVLWNSQDILNQEVEKLERFCK